MHNISLIIQPALLNKIKKNVLQKVVRAKKYFHFKLFLQISVEMKYSAIMNLDKVITA